MSKTPVIILLSPWFWAIILPNMCRTLLKVSGQISPHSSARGDGNLLVPQTSKQTMDPAVSLFLDRLAGTLYLHLFMIHPRFLDNSAILKVYRPALL